MKQKIVSLILPFVTFVYAHAQVPGVEWKMNYGNISYVVTYDNHDLEPVATTDGGFIFATSEAGPPNNPSPMGGGSDVVLTKVDKDGFIQWKKTFGGNGTDGGGGVKILKANDGGYIFISTSHSTDGDLPSNNDPVHGNLWFVKIDEQGNLISSKILKSDYTLELLSSIARMGDSSGYVLTMYIYDSNHSFTFPSLLTRCNNSYYSYKFLKIDNDFNLQFQKCIIPDGLLASKFTVTSATGNKFFLFDNGLVSTSTPCAILRSPSVSLVDDTMKVLWTKPISDFGLPHNSFALSSNDILKENSNSYIIPLYNTSYCVNNTQNNPLCIIKIDSSGNLIWKKITTEQKGKWVNPVDGNDQSSFLIARKRSDKYYNPLDSNVLLRFSYSDGSELGRMTYSIFKQYFPYEYFDDYNEMHPIWSSTGELYFWGYNAGYYDHSPFYSTSYAYTNTSLGKLGEVNGISGTVYLDLNANNTKDLGEYSISNFKVSAQKNNGHSSFDFSDSAGNYNLTIDTGNYVMSITGEGLSNFTVSPSASVVAHATPGHMDSANFALVPIPNNFDISIDLIGTTVTRPGFGNDFLIITRNNAGTGLSTGTIRIIKSPKMNFFSSSRPYASISGDTLIWNYSLGILKSDTIKLQLNVLPLPNISIFDTLSTIAQVFPLTTQTDTSNDRVYLRQLVRNSYDPNDKQERNGGRYSISQLSNGEYLQYTIRFQNTGNYPAATIIIKDTLSSSLDWNSVKMGTSSYPCDFFMKNDHELEWRFNNINLPDSVHNEPKSHGYLSFMVKPKSTLTAGSTITNKAAIYFDYNPPVITNDQETTVYLPVITGVSPIEVQAIMTKAFPNPFQDEIHLKILSKKYYKNAIVQLYANTGQKIFEIKSDLNTGNNWLLYPTNQLAKGAYFVIVSVDGKNYVTTVLKQ